MLVCFAIQAIRHKHWPNSRGNRTLMPCIVEHETAPGEILQGAWSSDPSFPGILFLSFFNGTAVCQLRLFLLASLNAMWERKPKHLHHKICSVLSNSFPAAWFYTVGECKLNYNYVYLVMILQKHLYAKFVSSDQTVCTIADTFGVFIQQCSVGAFHILHDLLC